MALWLAITGFLTVIAAICVYAWLAGLGGDPVNGGKG